MHFNFQLVYTNYSISLIISFFLITVGKSWISFDVVCFKNHEIKNCKNKEITLVFFRISNVLV